MPYFERLDEGVFRPTDHVAGAWNTREQHIAPAIGLLAHLVERDHLARRVGVPLVLSRLSYDILGTLALEACEVEVQVLRPGRTIELVEARLGQGGRDGLVLRAWLVAAGETADLAGTTFPPLPAPDALPAWSPSSVWPGRFIEGVQLRRDQVEPGRARFWARTDVPLLDEPVSATAAALRLVDIANGMTVRVDPRAVHFPNLDLTAHLFRAPELGGEGWLGFDTTVSFGPGGLGVTSSRLHDARGPFGTLAQSLTVRPLG